MVDMDQAEPELAEIARALLAALDALDVGVVSTERAGALAADATARRILGLAAADAHGRAGLSAVPGASAVPLAGTLELDTAAAQGRVLAVRHTRDDGRTAPLEVSLGAAGDTRVALVADLGARRHQGHALASSEATFRRLIETAPEGIYVICNGMIRYGNPAICTLLDYAPGELHGSHAKLLAHPDELPAYAHQPPPHPTPVARRLRTRGGSFVWTEIVAMPIEFEGEGGVLGFVRDITRRRAREAELLQADRTAAVGALAASVAHEINNPLAYVLLNLDLLTRDVKAAVGDPSARAEVLARLGEVKEGAERVAVIVQDLLSLGRGDDGAMVISVRDVIERAARMIKNDLRGRARLVFDLDGLPAIETSPSRLGQVCLNLILNALQALPQTGGHEVRVRGRVDGERVVIEVEDTGPGIPREVLPRLFEPFFTTKPVGQGTGLGLAICESLLAGMGGSISARNVAGAGACFAVTLPMRAPRERAQTPRPV